LADEGVVECIEEFVEREPTVVEADESVVPVQVFRELR
jgi:hypothetical protein